METITKANKRHPFNPRYWTALTWLGTFLWLWGPFWLNFIWLPIKSFDHGPGGELVLSETYSTIAEIPFPWGWPFSYVSPPSPFFGPFPTGAAPFVPPPPAPTSVDWSILGLNILLIVLATLALIYCLQKLFAKFSILTVMAVMVLFALYFTVVPKLAWMMRGNFAGHVSDAIYFSPVLAATFIRVTGFSGFETTDAIGKIAKLFRRREPNFDSVEDVLSHASQLDSEGQWEEAVKLYRQAVLKWPEQATYVENCIAEIDAKKALGR